MLPVVAGWWLASPAPAQRGGAVILDPKTYTSPSGRYALYVDPSTIYGSGAGTYRLTRDGVEVWAGTRLLTLWEAEVTDDGTVAGYAYSGGWENIVPEGEDGRLYVVIIAPDGSLRMSETMPRRGHETCTSSIDRTGIGVAVDPAGDRFVFRCDEGGHGRRMETWRVYRLSSGTFLDEFQFDHPREGEHESWYTRAARPVARTPLILVHWGYFNRPTGEKDKMEAEDGSAFSLVDWAGGPVWETLLPGDDAMPRLPDRDTTDEQAMEDAKRHDRVWDAVRYNGGIIRTDQPGQFDVCFVRAAQRVTFRVERDGESGWRVAEVGRADYDVPIAGVAATQPARLELKHLGTITLEREVRPLPEIRDVHCFDLDDRGRIGFLRCTVFDHEPEFILVDAEGHVLWILDLNSMVDGDNGTPTMTWLGGSRWLLMASVLREVPGQAVREAEIHAFCLDADTRQYTELQPSAGPFSRCMAATHDGGFVMCAAESSTVVSFDAGGGERWRTVIDWGDPYGGGAERLTVTTEGNVVVQSEYGGTVAVIDRDGKTVRTIPSKTLFDGSGSGAWFTPDTDGGLITQASVASGTVRRVRLDGTLRSEIVLKHADGRLVDLDPFPVRGPVCVDPSGRLWATDGQALLRLSDAGVVEAELGESAGEPLLRTIAAARIDNAGNVYLAEERNAFTHVFDSAGRRVRIIRPIPDDFEHSWEITLDVPADGRVFVGGIEFSASGERVGRRKLPEGLEEPGVYDGWVLNQPHGPRYWYVSEGVATLIDESNTAIQTIRRRPDRCWLDQIGGAAVGPDGGLALVSTRATARMYAGKVVSVYGPAGEPLAAAAVPEDEDSVSVLGNLAYSGRYALLGPLGFDFGRYLLLDAAASPPTWYDLGKLEPYEDWWRGFFVHDGRELWMLAEHAYKIERFALPATETPSTPTSQPDSSPAAAAVPESVPSPPLATLADLVGEYWCGDHDLYLWLRLLPFGMYEWEWRGDLGVYGRSQGTCEVIDGLLVLDSEDPELSFLGGRWFVPVTWGERLYLIPDGGIEHFRDTIAQGREPRIGVEAGLPRFYLREGDWEKPATGTPVAPAWWPNVSRGLVARRVEAPVTDLWSTTTDGSFVTLTSDWARLAAGEKQGLKPGMWLLLPPSPNEAAGSHCTRLFAVQKVEEESCDTRIILAGRMDAGTPHGVKVGDVPTITFCVAGPEEPAGGSE
ncbi:MAG: hypothetical protein PVJ57_13010 [Phycisphaerae bacterium]